MGFRINPARPFLGVTEKQFRRWFPKKRPLPSRAPVFEFGLVLAGAVSAGAYTAGVLDFLFQALDAWHAAKIADAPVPRHKVRLKILTGASAGGMNAAIAAVACRSAFQPVTDVGSREIEAANPFYNSWINLISIDDLLDTGDLGAGKPVESILNCTALDRIIGRVLDFRAPAADPAQRVWLDDPFPVVLTLTNLAGVPYGVRFEGETRLYHEMVLHRDDIRFGVPVFSEIGEDVLPPDLLRLGCEVSPDDDGWQALGVSALATGAFPMALKPREILRQRTDYEYRYAYMNRSGRHIYAKPWPQGAEGPHRFLSVDGGAMNNEPFEIARRHLAGSDARNPREGLKACRAVIMVDPFTDPGALSEMAGPGLASVAARLAAAYKQQSRFNQIDLSLAEAGDVYSRFLVAPSRSDRRGSAALASGGLGGFLGFFDRSLRHHDFLLGRANCQRFLRDWFTLPAGNPLFDTGGTDGSVWTGGAFQSQSEERPDHRQIIPLVGDAAEETGLPDWSRVEFGGYAPVSRAIERRLDALYGTLRDDLSRQLAGSAISRWAVRRYLDFPWFLKGRRELLGMVEDALNAAAETMSSDAS